MSIGIREKTGSDEFNTLREIALREPEAVASWLLVYMTYFRNFAFSTAKFLEESMGLRPAMAQLGRIVEDAIASSFHIQQRAAEKRGVKLESLEDLFNQNKYCHEEAASKLQPLGIEVFRITRNRDSYVMETDECGIFHYLEEAPALRVLPAALVAGLIRGLGFSARWLTSPEEKRRLCSYSRGRYQYVVYLDPDVEPPGCRIVTEPLNC